MKKAKSIPKTIERKIQIIITKIDDGASVEEVKDCLCRLIAEPL